MSISENPAVAEFMITPGQGKRVLNWYTPDAWISITVLLSGSKCIHSNSVASDNKQFWVLNTLNQLIKTNVYLFQDLPFAIIQKYLP